ncbi:PREDICTED: sorting nexin-17 [Polistes dominula]|uniref:Sorting nexin-17 n=1 Tax=Polistes dominula TaxID=743375 RepID=A0ABM1J8N1_POLDO|nr:PREDICTED: sorting nexin-17 [Polistes dominula]XP_015188820.1 PREDICTED: sorting nexin-17 [Polistes dominula]
MHFAIPDTQELVDESNSKYISYNVHINGLLHCTLRYRQFHSLHEQLVEKFGPLIPEFPPKKFFALTATQQEERRIGLEKYLQIIGQISAIRCSKLFSRFFFHAQQELANDPLEDESLEMDIYRCKKPMKVSPKLNTGELLKKIYREIYLWEEYHSYFSLFLVARTIEENPNKNIILRKLEDFESPVLTYKRLVASGIRVVLTIRKNYWNLENTDKLFKNSPARHLLVYEMTNDIYNKRVFHPEKSPKKLLMQHFKYYGYLRFEPCICDYPVSKSKVTVGIGNNEINLWILDNHNNIELGCKITRIRCWRITTLTNVPSAIRWTDSDHFDLELSFEYLFPDNKLQWITISSNQAILMSVSLQSMIDELVLKNTNDSKQESESNDSSWVHVQKDDNHIVMENKLVANIDEVKQEHEKNGVQSNVQKLIDALKSSVPQWTTTKKNKRATVYRESIEEYSNIMANNPFYMINDDVL